MTVSANTVKELATKREAHLEKEIEHLKEILAAKEKFIAKLLEQKSQVNSQLVQYQRTIAGVERALKGEPETFAKATITADAVVKGDK